MIVTIFHVFGIKSRLSYMLDSLEKSRSWTDNDTQRTKELKDVLEEEKDSKSYSSQYFFYHLTDNKPFLTFNERRLSEICEKDPDYRARFFGRLDQALQALQDIEGSPVSGKDLTKIYSELIGDHGISHTTAEGRVIQTELKHIPIEKFHEATAPSPRLPDSDASSLSPPPPQRHQP